MDVVRRFLLAWLALLLLGMQHELVAHEIRHVGAKLDRGSQSAVENPADGPCIECSLLAGGSSAAPGQTAERWSPPAPNGSVRVASDSTPRPVSPTGYLSRAPPLLD